MRAGRLTILREPTQRDGLQFLGVGQDGSVFKRLSRYCETEGVRFLRLTDAAEGLRAMEDGLWNVVFVLVHLHPRNEVAPWIESARRAGVGTRIVALVPAQALADCATREKFDVLPVTLQREHFREVLRNVRSAEEETAVSLPDVFPTSFGGIRIVSGSPAMLPVFRAISQVVPNTASVLVTGESGTGKELVARVIHRLGPRANGPFVAVNCAAIPESLLESELFGYERGAFTGAVTQRLGRFEQAAGGTLFLDEVGDMSLILQSKILRALEEREVERVGGTGTIPVDTRVIAATNRDLDVMMESKQFREDLYYRLAVMTIRIPSLEERKDELLLLASHFLRELAARHGKIVLGISDRVQRLLFDHHWIGNIRELRNVMERAVLMAEEEFIRERDLPEDWRFDPRTRLGDMATLWELEASQIMRAMSLTGGKIGKTASILGLHRNTLARKIREHGL